MNPVAVLSTFKVNTVVDSVAVNLKTGKDASGHISLRSAIQAANSKPNGDTILLPSGTFTLTLAGTNEDNAATGDLDLNSKVTIKGKGAGLTLIDGNSLDRVFQILGGKVQISGVTIEGGEASEGGGVLLSTGQLKLTSVIVTENLATGTAGQPGANGAADTTTATAGSNGTSGGTALGGGIANEGGSLTISKSTILLNHAQGGTGGAGGTGGIADAGDPVANTSGHTTKGGKGGAGGSGDLRWRRRLQCRRRQYLNQLDVVHRQRGRGWQRRSRRLRRHAVAIRRRKRHRPCRRPGRQRLRRPAARAVRQAQAKAAGCRTSAPPP